MDHRPQREDSHLKRTILRRTSVRAIAYAMVLIAVRDSVDIINLPSAAYMKDVLKLGPAGFASAGLLMGIPGYFGPVCGYIRDRWSPFGLGDRGYFVLVGSILAGICIFIFVTPIGYGPFVGGAVVWSAGLILLYSAISGTQTTLARKYKNAGWMATFVTLAVGILSVVIPLIGGRLAVQFAYRQILLPFSLLCIALAAFGLWRPKVVASDDFEPVRHNRHVIEDCLRLIRHEPFRKALLLSCLWGISPVSTAVLTFLVIDQFKGTMETVGQIQSLEAFAGLPMVLLFGFLATRFDLRRILFAGVAASIVQFAPLMWARTVSGVFISYAMAGILGDLVETALLDLKMRSCPEGLEGLSLSLIGLATSLMAGATIWLGAQIFQSYGIVPVVILSGLGSLIMLPFILRLRKGVVAVQ